MKTITYIFWRFWKFRVKKENGDVSGAYFTVTLFYALFFIGFPSMLIIGKFFPLKEIKQEDKWLAYLITIPIILLCSLPIRFIFPKKKILSLEYSDEERKYYKYNFYQFIIIITILIIVRYFHMKGYFDKLL
jgi:hypothetical protein